MSKTVLIVDDEPNIVTSLEFLVQQAGYKTRIARDGDAALASMIEKCPDLVLLDIMMPKRDGYDVCRAIRDNAAWAKVKIIMLTARGRDVDRDKGFAVGVDDYVTKPFSTQDVVERIRKILD